MPISTVYKKGISQYKVELNEIIPTYSNVNIIIINERFFFLSASFYFQTRYFSNKVARFEPKTNVNSNGNGEEYGCKKKKKKSV